MIPFTVTDVVRGAVVLVKEYRRWSRMKIPSNETIKVFYGIDHVPARDEKASGGIIKCQDLVREFPNSPREANILYLVSSMFPAQAVFIVKMAKKVGVKVVLNQNGVAYAGWYGAGWERSNEAAKSIVEQADYVFYQSEFCRAATDRFLGTREAGWEVLYNPVDTSVFVPAHKAVDKSRGVRLLLAGSHLMFYRVARAIETIAVLRRCRKDVSLTIAGRHCWCDNEKEVQKKIKEFIDRLGISDSIILMGAYSQEEAVPLLQQFHILLHTKYNDPCPRLVVEAMSCGLPIVYSASGGVPELVGGEAGIGIEAPLDWEHDQLPDPEILAQAVLGVLDKYEQFSEAARERAVRLFDVKPWLERHRMVFERLVRGI